MSLQTPQLQRATPTLEQIALARLRDRFPELRRRGFSRAVRAVDDEIAEEYPRIPFIPDGWCVESDELLRTGRIVHDFTCVEIEDGHPLSSEKLWQYCELWFSLDCFYCGLRLFVFDRYGLNERELDLCELHYSYYAEMYRGEIESAAAEAVDRSIDEDRAAWVREEIKTIEENV